MAEEEDSFDRDQTPVYRDRTRLSIVQQIDIQLEKGTETRAGVLRQSL